LKYLIDTNVVTEVMKPTPDQKVIQWLDENEDDLVIDAIILGEIYSGVKGKAEGRKRQLLEEWFRDYIVTDLPCLSWDSETSLVWGEMIADLKKIGLNPTVKDSMIAATAKRYGLVVVTRNVKDFTGVGVEIFNPFEDLR